MDKLKMHTPNKVQENIAKIAALFPNAVTETIKDGQVHQAIDFDVLRQELAETLVEGPVERYQFTWPDKRQSTLIANAPINKTLRPCREESVDFDSTENLYIEGDNLEALKLLQETYLGQVKLIYIDPPYNTGNDFVYTDDFAQSIEEYKANSGQFNNENGRLVKNLESSGRFHTDWLNMMYPRLKLAKDLLCDDGVILINIDENEVTNLHKICLEIFGEENDLGTIIWDKRNPKGDAKGISYQHEYILLFCKNIQEFHRLNKLVRPKKNATKILDRALQIFRKISSNFSLDDANRAFMQWISTQDFSGGEKAYNRIDEYGEVYQSVSMAWPNKKKAPEDYFTPLRHPVTKKICPVPDRGWRNPSSTMQELVKSNLILFGKDEKTQPRRKYLLKENMSENIPSLLYFGGSDDELLNELGIPFDTPKVTEIIVDHILSFTKQSDLILDFFSGSATTAHGVLQANIDGSKRKFILVQIAEATDANSEAYQAGYKNICEIGKERIRRAGKKIKAEVGLTVQNLDIGFRVLKVDSSNMQDVYYSPAETQQNFLHTLADNIKPERSGEDLLFQVMLDLGILLSAKIETLTLGGKTVFSVADGYLLACFDKEVNEDTIAEIARRKPYYAVLRDSSIANDSVAANFEQIFATYSQTTVRKVL